MKINLYCKNFFKFNKIKFSFDKGLLLKFYNKIVKLKNKKCN